MTEKVGIYSGQKRPPAGRLLKKDPQKLSGCIPFCRLMPTGLSGKRECLLVWSNTGGKPKAFE
ncbi:hypothetical protein [Desulfoluna limicola]|uniref:hypothetical protein n=1 Tax=Desulfoluna limicola TaxID=2810562 RepID=UPI001F4265A7|nr:hypothetical protein [Desulfoluna limicola]